MNSNTLPSHEMVVYTYLEEHDIHELVFLQATRQAVEVGMEQMMRIYADLTNESRVRLLIDLRPSNLLPMNNVIPQARNWNRNVKIHPQVRLALLTRPDPLTTLVKSIFDMLRFGHLRTQVFQDSSQTNMRDAAIAWLMQEK